jgi:3-methyladenine DNA glycosylase AlkC
MAFKDALGARAVEKLAHAMERAYAARPGQRHEHEHFEPCQRLEHEHFDSAGFRRAALEGLGALELKARVHHVARALRAHLPAALDEALSLAREAGARWEPGDSSDPTRGFAAWPLLELVGLYGLDDDARCFDQALATLRALTPLFSAEFAVRPFLAHDPARALATLATFTRDPDPHVRRLVSEGTRPRLPWGARLGAFIDEPTLTLPLLDALVGDDSEYVRRSVANHLNDVGKDHPELALATLERWSRGDASPARVALVKHAARSLVKAGHPRALALVGASLGAELAVGKLVITPRKVRLGEALALRARLTSRAPERATWVLDYAVHRPTKAGRTSTKVWKGARVTLEPGETRTFEKRHVLAEVTVRTLHAGRYQVELLVNGAAHARSWFELDA